MLKRWSLSLVLLSSLALAACSSTPPQTPAADVAAAEADAAATCSAQGGTLKPIGRLQRMTCVVTYADAGKTCSDKSDCSGRCLASGEVVAGSPASGTCQRDATQNFGCMQWIEGGVARPTICID